MTITPSLKAYTEQHVLPRYESYDAAHRCDHVVGVIERSLALATHYDVEPDMVYTIAAWHDLGLCYGRETHHLTSAQMLREEGALAEWFTVEQIATMAEAIEDHRASSDHTPRSIYGLIVAEADRQIIPQVVMRRTIQYGLAHYPELSHEEQWHRFVAHLHEKYDHGGYLKLYILHSDNAARLAELRALIARPDELRHQFEVLFAELTAQ
ncbi:MAG: HD domain-containing protein [Rikenellaceae bacterium]|nr:HD domain-containing protein [Rikenellaceae bacterium]